MTVRCLCLFANKYQAGRAGRWRLEEVSVQAWVLNRKRLFLLIFKGSEMCSCLGSVGMCLPKMNFTHDQLERRKWIWPSVLW